MVWLNNINSHFSFSFLIKKTMFVCQLEETQQKTSATENNERKKRRGGRLTNVRHGSQAGLLGLSSRGGSNLGNLLFDPSGGDRLGSFNGQAVDAVPQ